MAEQGPRIEGDQMDVGTDHCRVLPPSSGDGALQRIQFVRHLFAYAEAARFVRAHACVLEIGAGEGYGASHLAPYVSRLVASDLSPRCCTHAASNYRGIHCCVALATDLPFAAGVFDAVIAFQVVEHIHDVARCMQEIGRVLVPGGLVVLTTPNRKLRLLPLQRPWNPYHVREYSATELRRTMEHFFDSVQVYGVAARPDIMRLERARVARNPLRLRYRAVQRRWLRHLPSRLLRTLTDRLLLARKQRGRTERQVLLGSVELGDFRLTLDPDSAMDLFALASKRDSDNERS